MDLLKNLAEVSKEEQINYINSFDQVLLDIDGVIWIHYNPIPGAVECTENLQKLGKQVRYVTNNSLMLAESILKELNDRHFLATLDDIVNPIQTTISYLKNLNVDKELYVISLQAMKDALKAAGYKLVPDPPSIVHKKISDILDHYEYNLNVGAVIYDVDLDLNYLKLQKAYWYLKNPDCKFIVTIMDKSAPMGPRGPLLGTYHFVEALKEFSGREYIQVGKPSLTCVNYILEKYNVTNPNRILFIGDSIQADMSTGAIGCFQKLLVLSGVSAIEDVKNWQYPESYKPEYYVEDMGVLNDIIKSIHTDL